MLYLFWRQRFIIFYSFLQKISFYVDFYYSFNEINIKHSILWKLPYLVNIILLFYSYVILLFYF